MEMVINNLAATALIIPVNNKIYSIIETVSMLELSSVSKCLGNTRGELKGNNSTEYALQRINISGNNKTSTIINPKYLHRNEMQKLQSKNRFCCHLQP